MLGLLLLALWLAALSLCIQLWLITPRSKSKKRKSRRRPRVRFPKHVPLESRLTMLLNGDKATAQRLIGSTRRNHPNRSEQWCQEKAIHDLERDRR